MSAVQKTMIGELQEGRIAGLQKGTTGGLRYFLQFRNPVILQSDDAA
jgi:hypothetical protein